MHEKMSAPVVKRFVSLIIDLIILNIFVLGPFSGVFSGITDISSASQLLQNTDARSTITSALLMISVLIMLYYAILQSKFGQTIGMMITKTYAVKQVSKTKFVYPSFFEAVLRNLFVIPIAPFIFLWIIEPLFMFFDKQGRRLMEVASRTMTVLHDDVPVVSKRGDIRG